MAKGKDKSKTEKAGPKSGAGSSKTGGTGKKPGTKKDSGKSAAKKPDSKKVAAESAAKKPAKKDATKKSAKKSDSKKPAKKDAPKKSAKKSDSKKSLKGQDNPRPREPTLKELRRSLDNLKKQNEKLRKDLDTVTKTSKAQQKKIASLEGKMDTRVKREDIFMSALEMNARTKKGDKGVIGKLSDSVLSADDHILKMGKRVENMLSALKNHREYLIRLNKKVYKIDPIKKIEMELGIMNNTLSIMALSGFNIDKALFGDIKNINKMMAKEGADPAKVQKRMSSFRKKFEEELMRFDFDSIFRKSDHIPGYR